MWTESKPEKFPIFSQPDSEAMKRLMDKIPQFLSNVASVLQIKILMKFSFARKPCMKYLQELRSGVYTFMFTITERKWGNETKALLFTFGY